MKFSQSKENKVPRRPFLNSNPLRDSVGILGCLFAATSVYREISYNYFTFDGVVTSQFFNTSWDNFFETLIGGSIDGIIAAGVPFGFVVLVVGGIRRMISNESQPLAVATNKSKRWAVFRLLALATVLGFFAAYANASIQGVNSSDTKIYNLTSKPIPLECVAQGEDEKCVSGLQSGETVTLNYKLAYASARVTETDEIWSSSWTVRFDCSANSVTISNIEFYDLNGAKVKVAESARNAAKTGMENDYSALLSEC